MTNIASKPRPSVLVVGVYLVDKPNLAVDITQKLLGSRNWHVDCRWALLGSEPPPQPLYAHTYLQKQQRIEKTVVVNQLLADVDLADYEYVVVVDDDVKLCDYFLDHYLEIVAMRQYSLSQPARTHNSYIDHFFVSQVHGIESRHTNFVEIGPLFCAHSTCIDILFPLDEDAPMGWGLDFVWPRLLESNGLKMGIIDSVSIEHSLRKPVSYYDYSDTNMRMKSFFDTRPHLTYDQSFRIYESFLESK